MTLLPVADGARLLGIHPKTLHLWLKQAHMPVVAHHTDARIGCVEWERIQQVTSLHGRSLPSPATARPVASAGPTPLLPPAETLPAVSPPETELLQKLSGLETRVAHLSEQLAHLALLLLQGRDHTLERRLYALETLLAQLVDPSVIPPPVPDPQPPLHKGEHTQALPRVRPLIPAEERARSRLPPLIEYSVPGVYVIESRAGR